MRSAKRSRGAALLVAMLIAAMVAVIATKVGSHYILSFRRSSNMLLSDQGYLFLLSAEALAKNVLIADDPATDHLGEVWAQQVQPYVIEGGLLTGQIYDLQARFNLNNLYVEGATVIRTVEGYTEDQKTFIRLLRTFEEEEIEVTEQQAMDITNAAIDWLDKDLEPTLFSGAEDDYYGDLDIPYHAANRQMLSASELRLVKGMTAQLYKALLPHITALPNTQVKINTNTATENVMRSLKAEGDGSNKFEPRSLEQVRLELELREERLNDIPIPDPDGGDPPTPPEAIYPNSGEKSSYFLFDGLVKFGDLTVPARTVLYRDGGGVPGGAQSKIKVIRRSLGSL